MKIGDKGLALIKNAEGCRLESYRDSVGILTVGFGHTSGVFANETITQEEAEELLLEDIDRICYPCIEAHVDVDLNQNQYDALCSFIFNLGCGAFRSSTLLELMNAGDYKAAAQQFARWNRAGGVPLAGLTARRAAEAKLFSAPA